MIHPTKFLLKLNFYGQNFYQIFTKESNLDLEYFTLAKNEIFQFLFSLIGYGQVQKSLPTEQVSNQVTTVIDENS